MISLEDCVAMCGLTRQEVAAIAEHEHLGEISAAALADHLMSKPGGSLRISKMIRDDIEAALARGDEAHSHELLMTLHHFLHTHPEARMRSHGRRRPRSRP